MKKVIQDEMSKWICDATGKDIKCINEYMDSPSCNIKFNFGYESDLDGLVFELDFNEKIAEEIMDMLADVYPNIAKIIEERKKNLFYR